MSTISVADIVNYVEGLKGMEKKPLPANLPSNVVIQNFSETKIVSKPWGFEMWLAHGSHLPYALKMLYIKQGTKTSLQYHHKKREHNVVFCGTIRFHYQDKNTKEIKLDNIKRTMAVKSLSNINYDSWLVDIKKCEKEDMQDEVNYYFSVTATTASGSASRERTALRSPTWTTTST